MFQTNEKIVEKNEEEVRSQTGGQCHHQIEIADDEENVGKSLRSKGANQKNHHQMPIYARLNGFVDIADINIKAHNRDQWDYFENRSEKVKRSCAIPSYKNKD